MEISIFDVLGPVMVGPSSSHTAGAVRLGRCARLIAGRPFEKATFGLSGSFAETGLGHGTPNALLAGALGLSEDDERIPRSKAIARSQGVEFEFYKTDLSDVHENAVLITFYFHDGATACVTGCSTGGGRILITDIDGMPVELRAEAPSIVITQNDRPGVVSAVSRILAEAGINIGVMRVTRTVKGESAGSVLETDVPVSDDIAEKLRAVPNVLSVRVINL